jgi:hypothetical protein
LSPRPGLAYLLAGATGLAALILLLPLAGTAEPQRIARVAAYALVLACVVSLLHGFLLATRSYATPRVLALGAAGSGFLFAALARPENLEEGSGFLASFALFLADLCRILAAASVGVSLARHVSSAGVILLVAAVATASDLFSVFAGPTRTLVEEDSPILDLLLLVFPTFGSAPGFGLGASDFVFLALFAAASRFLNLRYPATLLCVCSATLLVMITGLLLERPLPAIPFVAGAFVLVNADLILASLMKRPRSSG